MARSTTGRTCQGYKRKCRTKLTGQQRKWCPECRKRKELDDILKHKKRSGHKKHEPKKNIIFFYNDRVASKPTDEDVLDLDMLRSQIRSISHT